MKHITLTLAIAVICSTFINAQDTIPNGGFEYWSGLNTPTFWESTNQFLPPGIFTIKKVDSEIDTGFAMQLQTLLLDATIIPGVATLGDLDIGSASGGVSFTGRPSSLSAYVKHPSYGDEVAMFIEFFKAGETIGYGIWSSTDSIGEYTSINVPITFMSAADPDTLNITVMSDPWSPESTLTLDNLVFNFPMTEVSLRQEKDLKIYPNPCKDVLRIAGLPQKVTSIQIVDMSGSTISSFESQNTSFAQDINIADIKPGIYFIIINSEGFIQSEKIIKN
ncbi:MAG: T9SS type A sorting domain-containing protein [Bacteroidales bacterium]|nr:T9SS type A sorting domain-containing protein [Bacteroidales bacterium]